MTCHQNTLEKDHLEQIIKLYKTFKSVDGLASLVVESQIQANDFSLNIPLYVSQVENGNGLSLEQCIGGLSIAKDLVVESRAELFVELEKWGLDVAK